MNYSSARVIEEQARIFALVAQMEAMKACNEHRKNQGYEQAYDEKSFMDIADEINAVGNIIHGLAERCE